MLHLHLTVAFRALDRKWGKPVDLDYEEDSVTCLPAVVDIDTTTFSSEEYLKTIKRNRHKPCQQNDYRKKTKLNKCDSFSNISITRLTSCDFYNSEEILPNCKVQSSTDNIAAVGMFGPMQKKKKGVNFLKQLNISNWFNISTKRNRNRRRDI